MIHWWGWTDTWSHRTLDPSSASSKEFDSLDDESCKRTFVSMLTNTMEEFIEKLNKGGWKYIACMVQLNPPDTGQMPLCTAGPPHTGP